MSSYKRSYKRSTATGVDRSSDSRVSYAKRLCQTYRIGHCAHRLALPLPLTKVQAGAPPVEYVQVEDHLPPAGQTFLVSEPLKVAQKR